jgi:hypothetical protein
VYARESGSSYARAVLVRSLAGGTAGSPHDRSVIRVNVPSAPAKAWVQSVTYHADDILPDHFSGPPLPKEKPMQQAPGSEEVPRTAAAPAAFDDVEKAPRGTSQHP